MISVSFKQTKIRSQFLKCLLFWYAKMMCGNLRGFVLNGVLAFEDVSWEAVMVFCHSLTTKYQ